MNMREKISKILAKAESTDSEAEAEMLLAKAAELMEEHQIGAHELGDSSDPIGMSVGVTAQAGPPSYNYDVQRALSKLYGCETMRMYNPLELNAAKDGYKAQTWRLEMTGPLSARVTTELMTEYVWDQLKALANSQGKEFGVKPAIQLRMLVNALTQRIWRMVHEARVGQDKPRTVAATKNALVLKEATKAFYDEFYKDINIKTTAGKSRTSNAAARTGAAGIGLHRQTGGSSTLRLGR